VSIGNLEAFVDWLELVSENNFHQAEGIDRFYVG